jgi:hypothetical protein
MRQKKRIRRLAAALAACAAALLVSSASAQGTAATITIRHQMRGCHTWSFNGGAYKATLAVKLVRGTTLTVRNDDIMPHKLVRTSGPAVRVLRPAMKHMGAKAQIRFMKAGVYRFTTKAGEDYAWASNMKTIGEDNILRLTVTVP